jgi:hypothetical protein
MNTSRAHALLSEILSSPDPFAHVAGWVAASQPIQENEYLEFKGATELRDDDAKRLWSKSLSGFANSGGGLVVFGIDARKDQQTGVDSAGEVSLVPNAPALASRLQQLTPFATDPPVQGASVHIISSPSEPQKGFVVGFVPESEALPHRAEHEKKAFYIRVADNFVEPSVSILRTMFYPRARAIIRPTLRINRRPSDGDISYNVDFYVENIGTLTASGALEHFK